MFKIILTFSFLAYGLNQEVDITINPKNVPEDITTCTEIQSTQEYKNIIATLIYQLETYYNYEDVKLTKETCEVDHV